MNAEQIQEAFEKVRSEIREAEKTSGRPAGSVQLCAVSKFHPAQDVLAALWAGQHLFGENRVQEAYAKFNEVRAAGNECTLHIIGALQLNKVKKAVEVAQCIQSVDREEVLAEIEKYASKIDKTMQVYFELHTGEDSKSGYADKETLLASVQHCADGMYPHIIPAGLMTMAPFTDDEKAIRSSFSTLRELRESLNKAFPSLPITELSMGMSGDFKIAIEEGSTMVRVGTALFGPRQAQ